MSRRIRSGFISERRTEKIKRVLAMRQPDLTIVLEEVHDIHNISAILRSCDAAGILEIHGVFKQTPSNKKSRMGKRSSAGTRKWVKFQKHQNVTDCFSELKSKGFSIFTTHISPETQSLYSLNLVQPIALVFGNEHDGVSEEALELADGNFNIPQVGMAESLNVSVACAVTLYEAYRQRVLVGNYEVPQISQNKMEELFEEWRKK